MAHSRFRPYLRRVRSLLIRVLYYTAARALAVLPWGTVQFLGARLGGGIYHLLRRDRRRALTHLAIAFPELQEAERVRIARAAWRHIATAAFEVLHLAGRSPADASRHVEVVGFEHVERLREKRQAVVVLTAHCGNWELISTVNHSHGLGLAAVARQITDPFLDQIVVGFRGHLGSETIARGSPGSPRKLLRTLRNRGALVLLIDQDIDTDGVWVPFFGRLAHTPRAATDLAQRLGAGVVPTFAERRPDGSHRVTFHPPLELPACPLTATAIMTRAIEEQIRRRPEQWVWFHRRWRRPPPEDPTRVLAVDVTLDV